MDTRRNDPGRRPGLVRHLAALSALFLAGLCGLPAAQVTAQEGDMEEATAVTPTQERSVEAAARHFLTLLDKEKSSAARYAFQDEERFDWGYTPRSRKGVAFRELSPGQREAALAMLRASLSEQGYGKATGIIDLEKVLQELEGRDPEDRYRSALEYYVTIFGTPGDSLWGWRLEGHHLSLNFSSWSREVVSGTPAFWGANPATVPGGPDKGKQVLKLESELGFRLVNSLDAGQRGKAIFDGDAPSEIITGDDRTAKLLEPRGIAYSELNRAQQELMMQLLRVYVDNYDSSLTRSLMKKIQQAGFGQLHFAWAGSLGPRKGHYYRIQGPTLLIEYDNTQDDANHVHTVVRDLTNDFGLDVLRAHYGRDHHK